MSANQYERWQIQEDSIVTLVTQAMTSGGLLAVQPNPDGTHGIKVVERIAPPELGVFPCVGVQFSHYEENGWGGRTHDIASFFDVVIAVEQPFSAAASDTGQAARLTLRAYINDGNGNGLSPLLRSNPTLFGNCQRGQIKSVDMAVLRSESEAASTIATAIYVFETHDLVRF